MGGRGPRILCPARLACSGVQGVPASYRPGIKSGLVDARGVCASSGRLPRRHPNHLVRACAVSTPASSSAPDRIALSLFHRAGLDRMAIGRSRLRAFTALPAESHGSEFSPLTRPNAYTSHESSGGGLHQPPVHVRRYRAGVDRGDDEVEEVDGERKIRDEFTAGDEEEDWDDPIHTPIVTSALRSLFGDTEHRRTYVTRLSNIQHNPSIHPFVTSPRNSRQSKKFFNAGRWPVPTTLTKAMRMMATR